MSLASVLAALPTDATTPDGLGGLFTVPDLAGGAGKTLFEGTGIGDYMLYVDLGQFDVVEKSSSAIYGGIEALSLALVRLAIGLSWWLSSLTKANGVAHGIGDAVSSVAGQFNGWLLPSALAVGLFLAWFGAKSGRDAFSQMVWVVVLAMASIGLASSGVKVVTGMDDGRQLLAEGISHAQVASQPTDMPFKWEGTNLDTGDAQRDLDRASGDGLWRTFAVVPWCQIQFGSQEACERYGAEWLELGLDHDKHEEFVKNVIAPQEGGEDSATVQYIQGKDPAARMAVSLFALVVSAVLVLLVGGLCLSALVMWATALLLLIVAVPFLCLMVIPGQTRTWGLGFLQLILGLTILSAVLGGLVSAALLAANAASSWTSGLGYLPSGIMTLAMLWAAVKARGVMEQIILSRGGSAVGGALGGLAAAMVLRTATRAGRRAIGRGRNALGSARRGLSQGPKEDDEEKESFRAKTGRRAHEFHDAMRFLGERAPMKAPTPVSGEYSRHQAKLSAADTPAQSREPMNEAPAAHRPGRSGSHSGGPLDGPRYSMPVDRTPAQRKAAATERHEQQSTNAQPRPVRFADLRPQRPLGSSLKSSDDQNAPTTQAREALRQANQRRAAAPRPTQPEGPTS